jgi:hypothetical protein
MRCAIKRRVSSAGVVGKNWRGERWRQIHPPTHLYYFSAATLRKALAETSKEGGMSRKENEEFLRQYYSERYMSMIFDNQR